MRASLARSPFLFLDSEEPRPAAEVDLYVAPAALAGELLGRGRSALPPVIAFGPAALLRTAFLAGAADYLREPWTPEELALRAIAVLGRTRARLAVPGGAMTLDGCTLDTPAGRVPLSFHEAAVLAALVRGRGAPVPRDALGYALWGRPGRPGSRAIDAHVAALRRKLSAAAPGGAAPRIVAVRGRGYMVR